MWTELFLNFLVFSFLVSLVSPSLVFFLSVMIADAAWIKRARKARAKTRTRDTDADHSPSSRITCRDKLRLLAKIAVSEQTYAWALVMVVVNCKG